MHEGILLLSIKELKMEKKQLFVGCFFLLALFSIQTQAQKSAICPDNYWFVEGQAGVGYTTGEASFGKLLSPQAALSIGKSFNPIIATRLQLSGWQGKGGWENATPEHLANNYSFDYAQVSLDAMFNLTNVFCGYEDDRCFNLLAIIGVGFAHSANYELVPGLPSTDAVNSAVARAGVQGNFRLNQRWDLNLELMGNGINDSFNAKSGSVNDWQFNLLAGFRYKFGHKAAKVVEDPCALTVASLNDKINAQREEIAVLQQQLQAKPRVEERIKTVTEKTTEAYIPFKIGKSRIAEDQLIHLYRVAQYLKENPGTTALITGYADAATGTQEVNQKISLLRAQAVANALIRNYGIAANRVTVDSKGATEQPFEENNWNRVAIMLTR